MTTQPLKGLNKTVPFLKVEPFLEFDAKRESILSKLDSSHKCMWCDYCVASSSVKIATFLWDILKAAYRMKMNALYLVWTTALTLFVNICLHS